MTKRSFCILNCFHWGYHAEDNVSSVEQQEVANVTYYLLDNSYAQFQAKNLFSFDLIKPEEHCNYGSNSFLLEDAIKTFDNTLAERNINRESLVFITDGGLHLRQFVISQAHRHRFSLPEYYYSYCDIRKEFKNYSKLNNRVKNLNSIMAYLMLGCENSADSSVRQCKMMFDILQKMFKCGYQLQEPEVIFQRIEPQVCYIDEVLEDSTVVRVRGLPWHSSDPDIYAFFVGLNIKRGGVAFCLNDQGRRNGEALVRFQNEEQRMMALKRHRHHLGTRYIEVYRASGKEFHDIAGGSNSEAKEFLNRNGKIIIRMRGLPFDSVAKNVIEFFESANSTETPHKNISIVDGEEGVLFVHYPDGRATGDAFVMIASEEEASSALLKHKAMMGPRYIELFRSTTAEVQQVLKRSQDPKNYQGNSFKESQQVVPLPVLPPDLITGGNRKDCIRLRNLPFDSGVEQILEFLGMHSQHIVQQGVHMIFNAQGHPSGEAFIQFDSELSSFNVSNHKNGKCMFFAGKKFYLEVLQCSGEEMNLVLLGVLPSNLTCFSSTTNSFPTEQSINQNTASPNLMYPPPSLSQNQYNSSQNDFYQNTSINQQFLPPLLPPQMPQFTHNNIHPQQPSFYNPANFPTPPVIYYMSPPVSPFSNMFVKNSILQQQQQNSSSPCVLIIKNAPLNSSIAEIIQFLTGYGEISHELVQIQNNLEVGSSDVFVTFFNHNEAERAVIEKNHMKLGNHIVELFLTI